MMTLLFDVWIPCRRSSRKVCCGGTPTSLAFTSIVDPSSCTQGNPQLLSLAQATRGISLLLFCSICSPCSAAHGRQSGARTWRHPARGRQSGGQSESLAKQNLASGQRTQHVKAARTCQSETSQSGQNWSKQRARNWRQQNLAASGLSGFKAGARTWRHQRKFASKGCYLQEGGLLQVVPLQQVVQEPQRPH